MSQEQQKPLMKTEEVAEMLGVRPETVRRWVRQNKMPCHLNMGSRLYFSREQIKRWLEHTDVKPETRPELEKLFA